MSGFKADPAVSDFIFREVVRPSEVPRRMSGVLEMDVPFHLTERRVFAYVEVKQSAAASYIFSAEIDCKFNGAVVGRLPLVIGDITALTTNQSLPCLFNAGGSPVGDTLVLRLNNPFDTTATGIQSAVLQPLRFNAEINKLVFNINGAEGANLVGWRAYLACLSTRY